ncbi:MAG: hypothetical protein COA74_15515 [Gammaproteobacteria bacterium]|nr:MAG: hypothetical protein COA74_15515 [Gammaproteobacteria bacterium]
MTEEETAKVEIDDVEPKAEKKIPKPMKEKKSLFAGLLNLMTLVSFICIGLLGYFAFVQYQQFSNRLSLLEDQQQNNQSLQSKTTTQLNENFQQLQNHLLQQIKQQAISSDLKVEKINKQLAETQRQIKSVDGRHQSDWLLAEADYLVRIASNRLLLERDFKTALALLLSADERILLMDDPSLQSLREALAEDIAILRTIQREDIAGIAMRINALVPQISSLAIESFQLTQPILEPKTEDSADDDWLTSLKKTFKELSVKWFEVRDHGRPVKPLMDAKGESVIRTNLSLLLQNAQYATLKQQPKLYQQSLSQLKDWVVEYFDLLDPGVNAFVKELDALNAMSVRVELPETLISRVIISRQLEKRLAQPSSPSTVTAGDGQ